jgi:hypothetical protein
MALESNGKLSAACLDGVNAFGEINRNYIRAAIEENPSLHFLLSLFELLYERGSGELLYYDEHRNYIASYYNKNGVRQACVLDAFLFCLAMQPVYSRIGALLGPDGALYANSDDAYLVANPASMPVALSAAPTIYKKVGLRIGWGLGKTELIMLPDVDSQSFLLLLPQACLPSVVTRFSAYLGVPRHPSNDLEFISNSLALLGVRHDRLLDLIEHVAIKNPLASLRLLQVCGVNRIGHIISAVPPLLVLQFATDKDDAFASTFSAIQQAHPPESSTHSLLVGAGGASITSLAKHASSSYLGAFFRDADPLHQRLIAVGGITNRYVTAQLANPSVASQPSPWASFVNDAHSATLTL